MHTHRRSNVRRAACGRAQGSVLATTATTTQPMVKPLRKQLRRALHCGTTAINLESLPGIIEQTALNARPLASHARVEDKRARVFKAAITRTPARIAWLPDCGPTHTRGAACEERQEES